MANLLCWNCLRAEWHCGKGGGSPTGVASAGGALHKICETGLQNWATLHRFSLPLRHPFDVAVCAPTSLSTSATTSLGLQGLGR